MINTWEIVGGGLARLARWLVLSFSQGSWWFVVLPLVLPNLQYHAVSFDCSKSNVEFPQVRNFCLSLCKVLLMKQNCRNFCMRWSHFWHGCWRVSYSHVFHPCNFDKTCFGLNSPWMCQWFHWRSKVVYLPPWTTESSANLNVLGLVIGSNRITLWRDFAHDKKGKGLPVSSSHSFNTMS